MSSRISALCLSFFSYNSCCNVNGYFLMRRSLSLLLPPWKSVSVHRRWLHRRHACAAEPSTRDEVTLLNDLTHCQDVIRRHQPDLFVPIIIGSRYHPALLILTAFHAELASQSRLTSASSGAESDSLLIRLQWWRTVIDSIINGEFTPPHPIARLLSRSVRSYNVEPARLVSSITARQNIVERLSAPFDSVADVHAYSDATYGALLATAMAAKYPNDTAATECARHVARAMGIVRIFQRFPILIERGVMEIPADVQERHQVNVGNALDTTNRTSSPQLVAAVTELTAIADSEIVSARSVLKRVEFDARNKFLMAVTFQLFLQTIKQYNYNLVAPQVINYVQRGGSGMTPILNLLSLVYHGWMRTI